MASFGWVIVNGIMRLAGGLTVITGTAPSTVGGVLSNNVTSVSNVGAGETDLMTFSLPANTLATNGRGVRITATWTTAANATAKNAKLYFGATVVSSLIGFTGSAEIIITQTTVYRTGAATQQGIGLLSPYVGAVLNNGTLLVTSPAETLSGAVTIKITGQGGVNTDITGINMLVELL